MFRITTDSGADLSLKRMAELEVPFAPLRVLIDGEDFPDDMTEEFNARLYGSMREGKHASTSQARVDSFLSMWKPLLKAGSDILHISFSSAMSGTFNSASLAKAELQEEFPERKLMLLDSLCGCTGQGMLVEHAVNYLKQGMSMQKVYDALEGIKLKVEHLFTPDTLTYLKRGGRISGATALLASLLNIKTVLMLDGEGKIAAGDKLKGRVAVLKRMIAILSDKIDETRTTFISIAHTDCMGEAIAFKNRILERFPKIPVNIYSAGGVVGAHVGPGTLALFFIAKEDRKL